MPDFATSYREGEWDFPALYESGQWEPETHEILKRFLGPGSLFLDVGAWNGPVSLWALDLGATVIALEPDPTARAVLETNTAGRDITILPKAMAGSSGLATLVADNYFGDSQSRLNRSGETTHFHNKPSIAVECVTPRQLFQRIETRLHRLPTFIKVDIEGGEAEVMPRLGPLCAQHSIPLLVAWHQDWWQVKVPNDPASAWFPGMTVEGPVVGWGQSLVTP